MMKKVFCIKLLIALSFNIFFIPCIHCGKKIFKGKFEKKSKHNLKWQKYAKKMRQQRKMSKPKQQPINRKKWTPYLSIKECKNRLKRRNHKKIPICKLPKEFLKGLFFASALQMTSCENFDDFMELGEWVFEDIKHNQELHKEVLKYGESIEDLFENALIEVPADSPLNNFGQNITFQYNVVKRDYSTLIGTTCVCTVLGIFLPILCFLNYYRHRKAGLNSTSNPPKNSKPYYKDDEDEIETDSESEVSTVSEEEKEITDSETSDTTKTSTTSESEIESESEKL